MTGKIVNMLHPTQLVYKHSGELSYFSEIVLCSQFCYCRVSEPYDKLITYVSRGHFCSLLLKKKISFINFFEFLFEFWILILFLNNIFHFFHFSEFSPVFIRFLSMVFISFTFFFFLEFFRTFFGFLFEWLIWILN